MILSGLAMHAHSVEVQTPRSGSSWNELVFNRALLNKIVPASLSISMLVGCSNDQKILGRDVSEHTLQMVPNENASAIITLELSNPGNNHFYAQKLKDFDPQVAPGTKPVEQLGLGGLVAQHARYNFRATLSESSKVNFSHPFSPMSRYLLEDYFPTHADMLSQLEIHDYTRLTPKQAVLLVIGICTERLSILLRN